MNSTTNSYATTSPSEANWQAAIELGFAERVGRTALIHRSQRGPLAVQRPFYPEGAPCHVYLLHPPGGLVAGDQLDIHLDVATGAHAVLTTPGATKAYRSIGPQAQQCQHLRVATDATLEWLPQELIAFDQCNVHLRSHIDLASGARFIGWEALCLGRPAGNLPWRSGQVRSRLTLSLAGQPLLHEALRLESLHDCQRRAGLRGAQASATLFAMPVSAEHLDALRAVVAKGELGITLLEHGLLVARLLAPSAETLRHQLVALWQQLRPYVMGRTACLPRIWKT